MAAQYQSIAHVGKGTSGVESLTVDRPSGVTQYDLLILVCQGRWNNDDVSTGDFVVPADATPWNLLTTRTIVNGPSESVRQSIYYKFASSSEPATYQVSMAGGNVYNRVSQVICTRVSGADLTTPFTGYAINAKDSFSSSFSFAGFTPTAANSLLLMFVGTSGNDRTTSGYAIATNNPSLWTEAVDRGGLDDGYNFGVAYASRPEVSATGNFSASLSGDLSIYIASLVGVNPSLRPFLTTQAVSSIDLTSATANGNVIADNGITIIERGVVYGTSTTPTTSNNKVSVSGTTGAFTAPLTDLEPGTNYYVRTYAINANGTFYGDEVTFQALAAEDNQIVKDIGAEDGQNYAVYINVGGSTGYVTVKLGSTGYSTNINAGSGVVTFEGEYEGANGLIIESSANFDGYVDDVFYVLLTGNSTEDDVNWSLSALTNALPIDSSVVFRRIEDDQFDVFRIYKYLDVQFKDQDAYVTVLLKKEANEDMQTSSKEFLVSNVSGEVLPFINKRLSILTSNQATRIGFSNARLNETFSICQFTISGTERPKRQFNRDKIISV